MKFTKEDMKLRQAEIHGALKQIKATADPLRAARDKFVQETDAKRREMDAELKAAEAPMFELKNELALISRALGGKSLNG